MQAEGPKKRGGAFPVTIPHLLYRDWQALKVDGRAWYAIQRKNLIAKLLEPFSQPVHPAAEQLARITACNLLLALRLEGTIHQGTLAQGAFDYYLRLCNMNSSNLALLYRMSREPAPAPAAPSLQDYLSALKSENLMCVEAETVACRR